MARQVSKEQFLNDYHEYRRMMGSTEYNLAELEVAFKALAWVWLAATATYVHPDTTEKDKDMMTSAFEALCVENEMRNRYRLMMTA